MLLLLLPSTTTTYTVITTTIAITTTVISTTIASATILSATDIIMASTTQPPRSPSCHQLRSLTSVPTSCRFIWAAWQHFSPCTALERGQWQQPWPGSAHISLPLSHARAHTHTPPPALWFDSVHVLHSFIYFSWTSEKLLPSPDTCPLSNFAFQDQTKLKFLTNKSNSHPHSGVW